MRPIALLSALTLVASSAAASAIGSGGTVAVPPRQEIEARNEHSLPSILENKHLMPRWEDGSETFGWPSNSVGRGTVDYHGPANGGALKFTFTASGISTVKSLQPRSSTSFEVGKAGEGFQVKVERS
ncbi:hypothetical protein FSARC_9551 [Fusarium sarcochroum]|uniref:Uncharacterized protein n=1 Tax=Fusarium sarcochroum TaxID=1208366 RepID=A0A8H4TQT5_9HYPO|nr:hypothetical protein FSARC_9551 [Fusarium sarcochroum]